MRRLRRDLSRRKTLYGVVGTNAIVLSECIFAKIISCRAVSASQLTPDTKRSVSRTVLLPSSAYSITSVEIGILPLLISDHRSPTVLRLVRIFDVKQAVADPAVDLPDFVTATFVLPPVFLSVPFGRTYGYTSLSSGSHRVAFDWLRNVAIQSVDASGDLIGQPLKFLSVDSAGRMSMRVSWFMLLPI